MVYSDAHNSSSSRLRQVRSRDGVLLALEERGEREAAPVIFAHGFGQTRRAWSETASNVAASGWRSITYDARGHGESEWLATGEYAVDQLTDDLSLISTAVDMPPVIVGASMGGLVGMAMAGNSLGACRALVLVDVTPRWESTGVARILDFMQAHPDGFASLKEAAEIIASYLPQRVARKSPDRLRSLLTKGSDGRLRWHWDPRMLGPLGTDAARHQSDLESAARKIRVPTLLITGGASDVVSDQTISEFLELVPHASHVQVANATHMVAGDENSAFTRHVLEFLSALPGTDAIVSDESAAHAMY